MTGAMFQPLTEEERTASSALVPEVGEWRPIISTPQGVLPTFRHGQLGDPSDKYAYTNAYGELEGYQCRFPTVNEDGRADKEFRPCRYGNLNGKTGWHWKGWGPGRPLYRLPELLAAPEKPILILEGEGKTDVAQTMFPDFACTSPMNGAKSPHLTNYSPCEGRPVIVWPDHDAAGATFARNVASLASAAKAESVAIVEVPADFPPKWDLANTPPDGWDTGRLSTLLQVARPWDGSSPEAGPGDDEAALADDEALFTELAALSRMEYDRRRQREAKRLGVRVPTLDTEVDQRRPTDAEDDGGGGLFSDLEPWPETVDGAELLDSIVDAFTRRVVLPDGAADALALWVLFVHAHDAAQISPILALVSPEKRCGKTTTLSVIQALVPRALPTSNISPAALFRAVEKWTPTILIDEADTFLRDSDELRGILNSGHTRPSAYVVRTVGDEHEPKAFRTWAPKTIALIGTLPDTLADRAIAVRLRRKRPDETVERVRLDRMEVLTTLARQAARWVEDNLDALSASDPETPAELHDRAADNWRALLAIADRVGGDWPARARATATELSKSGDDDDSARVMLLADIHGIFAERDTDRIVSADMLAALVEREDRPWPEWRHGKPLTARGLAKLLAPFGIAPGTIRNEGGRTAKGYRRGQFDDAFSRYSPNLSVTPSQPAENLDFSPNSIRHKLGDVTDGKTPKPAVTLACDGVTDENQETARERGIEAENEEQWSVSL